MKTHKKVSLVCATGTLLLLLLSGLAQAAPSLTLTADKKKAAVGDTVTLTAAFIVPTADTVGVANVVVSYTAPLGLTIQSATGPALAANIATVTWDGGGTAMSNTVYLRLVGATPISYLPTAGKVTIPMGDFAPGEGDLATITIKR